MLPAPAYRLRRMAGDLVQIGVSRGGSDVGTERRPDWLRIKLATPAEYHRVRKLVDGLQLNTV